MQFCQVFIDIINYIYKSNIGKKYFKDKTNALASFISQPANSQC